MLRVASQLNVDEVTIPTIKNLDLTNSLIKTCINAYNDMRADKMIKE
ncbi:hypothetical protein SDC49_15410 [Lactobacillus sp. R2/2]|nr:hypothetical protein [Lactobacillus sp. R2/2]